ncbi:hypothetical protein U9M48_035869 [Paspalum notatum var. saurae]|uniref:Uncharacterized protein n=1 Tax=Paspalum notatum var. saurae TaxID=547442 RepID=A0AAQ3X810_PASNO
MTYLLHSNICISPTFSASICILAHSYAYDVMHIDPANEELPPEQPLIEEPEDEPENPQPTADHVVEEANPSEEVKDTDVSKQALRQPYGVPLLCLCWWWAMLSSRMRRVMIWQGAASMARTKQTARKATGARITALPDVTHTPPVVEDGLLHTRCREECSLSQLLCRALYLTFLFTAISSV